MNKCYIIDTGKSSIPVTKDLKEYVDSLEKENKQLKEEKLKYKHLIVENYRLEHNERVLSERIDKAIELFEKCKETNDFSICDLEMYEILKGDSNE